MLVYISIIKCHERGTSVMRSLTWVWKHPFYQQCSQEVGMSSSDTLGSDWLQMVWWVRTLVSLLLLRRCFFPLTTPARHRRSYRSAWSCVTGYWIRFLGECCCNESRRRCRCRWSLPCWEGRGRHQPGHPGNPHLLGLLQLLRQTSAHHCGCWRRCWTECYCWSDSSTESHPAENMRTRMSCSDWETMKQKRWKNDTVWSLTFEYLFGESFPGTSCLGILRCPPPPPGPRDDDAGTCQRGSTQKTHTDTHRIKANYTEPSWFAKRIKYL